MLQSRLLPRIAAIVLLGMSLAGCEVIGGIFKTGFWAGAITVVVIVLLLVFVVSKFKR
jgi:hypothetical protein